MSEVLKLMKPVMKRWLQPEKKFRINISYESGVEPTERTLQVSDAFGLGVDKKQKFKIYDDFEVDISPKDVVYISGDSGSGKSVLLRWLNDAFEGNTVTQGDIHPFPTKPLIEQVGGSFEEGLTLLSKAGLNDAFLFVRRYHELSDGQKYRFMIAKMMESHKQYWIFDEFCSTLDRDTAKIVAFNIQKLARKTGRGVIVATCHLDLFDDLKPSVYIYKKFGKEAHVNYYPNQLNHTCSLVPEFHVEEGKYEDWRKIAHFHYRGHRTSPPRKIFCLKRKDELAGVIVYCYPPAAVFGRKEVISKEERKDMKTLNKKLSIINRVVVHPKYRTLGLGHWLIEQTLNKAGTRYVELVAVMAKYNPFAEKAGMRRIAVQEGNEKALKVGSVLRDVGFNMQLLGSRKLVLDKLKSLNGEELAQVKDAFSKHRHLRFMKSFFHGRPYGSHGVYRRKVLEASLPTMAYLIKVCGMLMQTKVYLFWDRETEEN